jgi:organic hydroperoxide reductase OsmC/OhrA
MAHEYRATVKLARGGDETFTDQRYSRGHTWSFDGGITVPGSSSPLSVRLPYSVAEAIDPEEAFVAAVSSCHMLTFLYVAAKRGFVVDAYADDALGVMTKNEKGRMWVSKVTLAPAIVFAGDKRPTDAQLEELHHLAHDECYIANSVKSEIVVQGSMSFA